jgi:hypothetical protein
VVALVCVSDVGEGVTYRVAVLSITVTLRAVGGGGGGGSPLRMGWNGGSTTPTVAHSCMNQFEVDSKSAESQLSEKQGIARLKNAG